MNPTQFKQTLITNNMSVTPPHSPLTNGCMQVFATVNHRCFRQCVFSVYELGKYWVQIAESKFMNFQTLRSEIDSRRFPFMWKNRNTKAKESRVRTQDVLVLFELLKMLSHGFCAMVHIKALEAVLMKKSGVHTKFSHRMCVYLFIKGFHSAHTKAIIIIYSLTLRSAGGREGVRLFRANGESVQCVKRAYIKVVSKIANIVLQMNKKNGKKEATRGASDGKKEIGVRDGS